MTAEPRSTPGLIAYHVEIKLAERWYFWGYSPVPRPAKLGDDEIRSYPVCAIAGKWPVRSFQVVVTDTPEKVLYNSRSSEKSYPDALDSAVALGRYHGHPKITLHWGADQTEVEIPLH